MPYGWRHDHLRRWRAIAYTVSSRFLIELVSLQRELAQMSSRCSYDAAKQHCCGVVWLMPMLTWCTQRSKCSCSRGDIVFNSVMTDVALLITIVHADFAASWLTLLLIWCRRGSECLPSHTDIVFDGIITIITLLKGHCQCWHCGVSDQIGTTKEPNDCN